MSEGQVQFQRIKSRRGGDNKDLNLFTGLLYRISVKSIPNGLVSFETLSREGQDGHHLVQLALNYLEDYDPTGDLRRDSLWTIVPEESSASKMSKRRAAAASTSTSTEVAIDYRLRVMSLPEANLTYSIGSSWGGRYVELDVMNSENYLPGANMYSSALWYFNQAPDFQQDYVTWHNSDERRDPNFLTFSNEPSERGQIMQIGTKELERYEVRGPFRNDALWNFKPANYTLSGRITNFRVELPPDSEIADEAYPFQVMEKVVTREDRTVNHIEAVPETFLLQFLQSFKPFISSSDGEVLDEEEQEERVTINLKDLASKIPFLSQRKEYFETKAPFLRKSNTQWISYGQMEHRIEQTFERWAEVEDDPQAPPVNSLKVKGYCNIVKELEIPFTADLEVTLKSDVFSNGEILTIHDIKDKDVLQYILLGVEKFKGKVVPEPQKKPSSSLVISGSRSRNPSNNDNPTPIPSDHCRPLVCQVSGRLKCTCVIDTFIDVKALKE
jgi:hypothetical protein